jgi:hypothetical protein
MLRLLAQSRRNSPTAEVLRKGSHEVSCSALTFDIIIYELMLASPRNSAIIGFPAPLDAFLSEAVVECCCFPMILAEMSSYDIDYNAHFGV